MWAQADVPEWALDHAVSVLNEFLDSNEDGIVDDPKIMKFLATDEHSKDVAVLTCRGGIDSGSLKDLFWSFVHAHGQESLDEVDDTGIDGYKRNCME